MRQINTTVQAMAALIAACTMLALPPPTQAANSTECTSIKLCYCVNQDFLPLIDEKVKLFRQLIAEQKTKGKAVGYLSVPLSTTGGGYFNVNAEVAAAAKERVEARFGADSAWLLNPAAKEADLVLASGVRGQNPEYMLMWTRILEGANTLGEDFDFVYFAGPSDFSAYFGLTGKGDMDRLVSFFDDRIVKDPGLKREAERGRVTRAGFRNYYALRASASFSAGAHDEWNIFRMLNERRRTDPKYGVGNQIPVLFDGKAVSMAALEQSVAAGSSGSCKVN